ncbi:MAG: alpha/beta hydrolase [Candidatus Thorarchaeota archaeon]|nr:MAG: alpha/beta hydrolase [Candidatus Thorarchaeota archaeon]
MGLASQMTRWDVEFCEQLASQGFWVIRFDNRDIGRSTKIEEAGPPNLMAIVGAVMYGKELNPPYSLQDMAADAIGLLDALDIESAHVMGASMGGMIAQIIATEYPERVRTLTSIMSSTNNPDLPGPSSEAQTVLLSPPSPSREKYIEDSVKAWKVLNGPVFPIDEDLVREKAGNDFDRSYYPDGSARQLMAILAVGDRTQKLGEVKTPTLVIHGDADPLVPVECGKATAEAIVGSKLLIIEGMGHSIPVEVAPRIIDAISEHAKKA